MARRKKTTTQEIEMVEVTLRVPLLFTDNVAVREARVQNLSHSEQRTMRALFDALTYQGATVTTALERPVKNLCADPMRWLLQEIGRAAKS